MTAAALQLGKNCKCCVELFLQPAPAHRPLGCLAVSGICVESLGNMQVLSESGIASGVRRIEAAAGPAAVEYVNSIDSAVKQLSQQLKAKPEELPGRVVGECHRCPLCRYLVALPSDKCFCRLLMPFPLKAVSRDWMNSVDSS